LPAGSVDAQVEAILREMVAGEGSAGLRPRVMAALARAHHRQPRGRSFPELWLALAGSLAVSLGVAIWIGPGPVSESRPGSVETPARVAPGAHPSPSLDVGPAADTTKAATRPFRVSSPTGHVRRVETASDSPEDLSLPSLEVLPIQGTSPLALPAIGTPSLEAPELAFRALEIDALPSEPTRRGSF
jgi:hypothetical protein